MADNDIQEKVEKLLTETKRLAKLAGVTDLKREYVLKSLRDLQSSRDTEGTHASADQLLLEFIDDAEIEEAYRAVPKWYA